MELLGTVRKGAIIARRKLRQTITPTSRELRKREQEELETAERNTIYYRAKATEARARSEYERASGSSAKEGFPSRLSRLSAFVVGDGSTFRGKKKKTGSNPYW